MGTRADAPIEQKGHDYNVGGHGERTSSTQLSCWHGRQSGSVGWDGARHVLLQPVQVSALPGDRRLGQHTRLREARLREERVGRQRRLSERCDRLTAMWPDAGTACPCRVPDVFVNACNTRCSPAAFITITW